MSGIGKVQDCGTKGRMDTNDSLRVASLWHSMHAISQQLSPVNGCSGIELLQADTFDLHCFQSLPGLYTFSQLPFFYVFSLLFVCWFLFFLSGTKFFVVCEPGTPHMESLLRYVYELYTDYVLKNPFYEIEMPIRCELFDINLTQAVQSDRVALLGRWPQDWFSARIFHLCACFTSSSLFIRITFLYVTTLEYGQQNLLLFVLFKWTKIKTPLFLWNNT